MATVFLTYDLKETTKTIHTEFKKRMIEHYGYTETVVSNKIPTVGKVYPLPNTTLRKQESTREQTSTDFLSACADVGAVWESYLSIEYTRCQFDYQPKILKSL